MNENISNRVPLWLYLHSDLFLRTCLFVDLTTLRASALRADE